MPLRVIQSELTTHPRTWLVTGGAGFIGSHLVESLLQLDQRVVALDNLSTGHRANVDDVITTVGAERASRLEFIQGDIRDAETCRRACKGVEVVLHQAALGSVPRSIKDPTTSHDVNVTGFINMALAARDSGVRRFVYASSSSVYGDHADLPKREAIIGRPLSPYAVTKLADELYAGVFASAYGLELIGLRYFNVFGPRQDPDGPYAAVMPKWFAALMSGAEVVINGDGETSRDFCYVANAVQANLLAGISANPDAVGRVFNVACGEKTSLNELFLLIRSEVARFKPAAASAKARYAPLRPGDIRHSLADIAAARNLLGYAPSHRVPAGLVEAAEWYAKGCSPDDRG